MDGARSALRIPDVERVYIIYRRSEAEIPAEREEFELAKTEGSIFLPLLAPIKYTKNSILVCKKIILGERGRDGRRIPVETEETVEIPVDSVITALGEEPDRESIIKMGLTVTGKGTVETQAGSFATSRPGVFAGGDVRLGASSVVKALADGRGAAEEILSYILKKSGKEILDSVFKDSMKYREVQIPPEELIQRKGLLYTLPQPMDDLTLAKREEFRCLHCGLVCNKCVDVCPNRANIALDTQGKIFKDRYQILHLDDPCNECGNCYTFCPFEGRPYKDKLTLFSSLKTFEESENNGAFFPDPDKADIRLRLGGEIYLLDISQALEQEKNEEEYSDLEKVSWLFSLIFREYHYLLERRK